MYLFRCILSTSGDVGPTTGETTEGTTEETTTDGATSSGPTRPSTPAPTTTTAAPPSGTCNCGVAQRQTRTSGSLLSARHVLTAAHCTVGSSPSSIRVLVGEHDTTDSVADIRTISAITDHPSYNNANTDYDFSILTLAAPITFSSVAAPVCLPASASSLYTGQVATVTGWGTTSFGGSLSSTLLEVDVTVVSNGQCSNSYSGIQK